MVSTRRLNRIDFECGCGHYWILVFSSDMYGWKARAAHAGMSVGEFEINLDREVEDVCGSVIRGIRTLMSGNPWKDSCSFMPAERKPQVMMS